MRILYMLPLLLVPLSAEAARECRNETPIPSTLDLQGIESITIDIGSHDLELAGSADGKASIDGRACASDIAFLPRIDTQREGTTLVLKATTVSRPFLLFGSDTEWMQLSVMLPQAMPVVLRVGSGDARVEGMTALDLNIGSGDVRIPLLHGPLALKVGSGDLVAGAVGALDLHSVGSGDVTIEHVRGAATVGNVGSGDLTLRRIDGDASIESVGSGDVALQAVAGSVTVQRLGSGDVVVRDVAGDLTVQRKGSGDVRHSGVKGTVAVPER
jgi:hypothetical protein